MGALQLLTEAIDEIAARLDLRQPNKEAVQTLAAEVSQHYDVDQKAKPFEAVLEVATGVGKTYILTGAMELFWAANGVRDFVIVTPGRTILQKTRDNFTPGHPKSLLAPMSFQPVVITSENFNSPAMRAAMDDPLQVKVYLFTVQALIKPDSKVARKTHVFQEGIGSEFYAHLQGVGRLVVFADEHHTYYGAAFSKAMRDLNAWALVGLTATPDKKTPPDQIIFRYPLAAAIADKLIKTPVIVGRKDDLHDPLTKLTDAITLLNTKRDAVDAYVAATGAAAVNPVLLVVAEDISDADDSAAIVKSEDFFAGQYADAVLVVHSKSKDPDAALEELGKVEEPTSPVRIIISVGMLKEGWDVRNVYVILSLRPSVSSILTEQTLGRGMRLPFGAYTGIEILDTLEVIAHERYEEVLRKANVLNKSFIDYRTRAAVRLNARGQQVVVTEKVTGIGQPILVAPPGNDPAVLDNEAQPVLTTVEQRAVQAGEAVLRMKQPIARRQEAPIIMIPLLKMSPIKNPFTLADITDTDRFRKLGASLASDPDGELSRTVISAEVVVGLDNVKRTDIKTSPAADTVVSAPRLFPIEDLRAELVEMILASPAVPARKDQQAAVQPLIEAFFVGLGSKAVGILSAYLGRAGARLVRLVSEEQRRFTGNPEYDRVVELKDFNPARATDRPVSGDRLGIFSKAVAYDDWKRSLFAVEWFDSKPERTVANMVDADSGVRLWVRLHIGELPILWNSLGQEYNPDLIVIDVDETHWVVEVKMDREMASEEVRGKRDSAMRWANYVTADVKVRVPWRYLLVSETDVETARASWPALKKLGGY